jgi:hypothetical protein
MIKCYFVDVKSIRSNLPKSSFIETEIEQLADLILAVDGLLRPLILQKIGVDKYTVIEGHQEYYAAVRAKEKDIKKAEMVNAFVIDDNLHKSAVEQLTLLKQPHSSSSVVTPTIDIHTLTELLSSSIQQLLPVITTAISTQLQPIVVQLTEHQQILDTIKLSEIAKPNLQSDRVSEAKDILLLPIAVVEPPKQPEPQELKPAKAIKATLKSNKKSQAENIVPLPISKVLEPHKQPEPQEIEVVKTTKSTPKSSKKSQSADILPSSITAVVESPKPPDLPTVKSVKTTKPAETKIVPDSLESIDLVKYTNALNLINTLTQEQLTMSMERSGVSKAVVKLVASIIAKRDSQPEQKFGTWKNIIDIKIGGLTTARIQEIINKLK